MVNIGWVYVSNALSEKAMFVENVAVYLLQKLKNILKNAR